MTSSPADAVYPQTELERGESSRAPTQSACAAEFRELFLDVDRLLLEDVVAAYEGSQIRLVELSGDLASMLVLEVDEGTSIVRGEQCRGHGQPSYLRASKASLAARGRRAEEEPHT